MIWISILSWCICVSSHNWTALVKLSSLCSANVWALPVGNLANGWAGLQVSLETSWTALIASLLIAINSSEIVTISVATATNVVLN